MLLAPRWPAVAGLFLIRRPVRIARVLHGAEKSVVSAEHVQDHLPHGPLALGGRAIEIVVAQSGDGSGEIAVRVVVLAEDALGLRRRHGPHRGEPHREVAQLVLRQEERETKSLLVVLAPHPRPVHLRIWHIDRRADERFDSLGYGGH